MRTRHLKLTMKGKRDIVGYTFVLPALLCFAVFVLLPLCMSVYLSLYSSDMFFFEMEFRGLGNFVDVFKDKLFWSSIQNILLYTVMAVPLNVSIALLLASLVNTKIAGAKAFRLLYFLPSVMSAVAASTVWLWMMNPSYGLLNRLLEMVGIDGFTWLSHSKSSLFSVTLVTVWQGIGTNMIIFLAALQNMPMQVYEAAKIDGANKFTIFFKITLPLIAPTMFFILTMTLIGAFQLYDQVYVLTSGGPANSTMTPVYLIWQNSFGNNSGARAGYATAQSMILFLIIMAVTFLVRKLDRDSTK